MEQFDDRAWGLSVEIIGVIAELDRILDEYQKQEVDGEPHLLISESDLIDIRDAVYGGLLRSLGPDAPELLQQEYDRRSGDGTLEVDKTAAD